MKTKYTPELRTQLLSDLEQTRGCQTCVCSIQGTSARHLPNAPQETFLARKGKRKTVGTPNIYERHSNAQYFWSLRDAYQWTTEFMAFYNEFRIHGFLGMSPSEFVINTQIHGQEKLMQWI